MPHQFEQLVKNRNSLAEIREAIQSHPELCGALQDSMSAPLTAVGRGFQAMNNAVKFGVPTSEAHIDEQFQHALFIDPALTRDDLTAKGLQKAISLKTLFYEDSLPCITVHISD